MFARSTLETVSKRVMCPSAREHVLLENAIDGRLSGDSRHVPSINHGLTLEVEGSCGAWVRFTREESAVAKSDHD